MKIGDKVRFLNEIGGGKIVAFKKNNIVLVEDEDGFEIPMQLNDIAIVQSDDYSTAKVIGVTNVNKGEITDELDNRSIKSMLSQHEDEEIFDDFSLDYDPADREITFKEHIEERKGGNKISAYLAFLPLKEDFNNNTTFKCYLVNDSNYNINYSYLVAKEENWILTSIGVVEANTKIFIEEISKEQLNNYAHVAVQLFAYKEDKSFLIKPTIDSRIRIDAVKFFKKNAFKENDFFNQDALLYTIVKEDVCPKTIVVEQENIVEKIKKHTETFNNTNVIITNSTSKQGGKKQSSRFEKRKTDIEGNDIVVVDLHADALLETTAGMGSTDILNYQLNVFHEKLKEYRRKKGQKIVFIHGKGEGILRNAIINELRYKYKQNNIQDASFQEYGYGATQITIK
ncbi:MAG: DUF2027 domain-containing protein [Prevotella sp.]